MRTMSCRHAQLVRPLLRKPEMPMNGRNWPIGDRLLKAPADGRFVTYFVEKLLNGAAISRS